MTLGLGIDTGGTYTDSVIADMGTNEVLCRSKALTTRDDLVTGIVNSLNGLDRDLLGSVSLVSLSSTLATNSVVEGKSCRVGLICIGKKFGFTVPPTRYAFVDGEYDLSGNVITDLDKASARKALEGMRGEVDSLAVVGYLSVRNPGHENAVCAMAERILGVPVVCAHELTSQLGFKERANTALVNAGLIPVIVDLIRAVGRSLGDLGIDAPLMIVKGDGSVMNAETAVRRPVETILSGPASSLIGAMALTDVRDAVIADIGGTTTDIGVLRGGFPRTMGQGATIGGHRTRVRAADISTYGIGGDSRILVNGEETVLSPTRIIPICIASSRWPHVSERLAELDDVTDARSAERLELGDVCQDTEFFVPASNRDLSRLGEADRMFVEMAARGPLSLAEAGAALDTPVHTFSVADLESRGYLTRIGVTPTDILAAEGTYAGYDAAASRIAVGYLARKCGLETAEFIRLTKSRIVRRIAGCIMESLMREDAVNGELDAMHLAMIDEILYGESDDYALAMRLRMPIVGIGAPVGAWLPMVADMLGTELVLPENYDVGNAIGAVTSSVTETVTVTVRAASRDLSEDPECNVFTRDGVSNFPDSASALEFALDEGARIAKAMAADAGASEVVIDSRVEKILSDLTGSGKRTFRGAAVTVRATGKPDLAGYGGVRRS